MKAATTAAMNMKPKAKQIIMWVVTIAAITNVKNGNILTGKKKIEEIKPHVNFRLLKESKKN